MDTLDLMRPEERAIGTDGRSGRRMIIWPAGEWDNPYYTGITTFLAAVLEPGEISRQQEGWNRDADKRIWLMRSPQVSTLIRPFHHSFSIGRLAKLAGFRRAGASWRFEPCPDQSNGVFEMPTNDDHDGTSVVYFVQSDTPDGSPGPIKVGHTTIGTLRMYQLQVWAPWPLRLVATMLGGRREEALLHQRFSEFRLHGEWFAPAPPLLALIASLQNTEAPR